MNVFEELSVRFSSECEALEEMHKMGSKCANGDFVHDEDLEKQYMHDDKVIRIIARIPTLPDALVILYANDDQVEISNIIPYNKSVDTIERDVYNKIVDEFYAQIIKPMYEGVKEIVKTDDMMKMESLIPKTFEYLNRWTHCPGAPNSPFGHQNDLEMWFLFLCKLRVNHETLSSGDLEQWLTDDLHWENEVVTDTIIRYETEVALLEYYDVHVISKYDY